MRLLKFCQCMTRWCNDRVASGEYRRSRLVGIQPEGSCSIQDWVIRLYHGVNLSIFELMKNSISILASFDAALVR